MRIRPVHFSFYLSLLTASLFIGIVTLNSCTAPRAISTNLTGSWKDPEAKNYKDIFVAVLSKNLPARTTLEDDISRKLKREGVKATRSLAVLSSSDKVDTPEEKKAAVAKIQSLGYDAIITVTLVKKTEQNRYVPGTNSYAPANVGYGTGYYDPRSGTDPGPGQYGAFGVYYVNASSAYNTPGYYEVDKTYFVESNIYDLKTAKLVWSAQSETFFPGDLATASSDFSLVMVEALKKAGLLYEKEKK